MQQGRRRHATGAAPAATGNQHRRHGLACWRCDTSSPAFLHALAQLQQLRVLDCWVCTSMHRKQLPCAAWRSCHSWIIWSGQLHMMPSWVAGNAEPAAHAASVCAWQQRMHGGRRPGDPGWRTHAHWYKHAWPCNGWGLSHRQVCMLHVAPARQLRVRRLCSGADWSRNEHEAITCCCSSALLPRVGHCRALVTASSNAPPGPAPSKLPCACWQRWDAALLRAPCRRRCSFNWASGAHCCHRCRVQLPPPPASANCVCCCCASAPRTSCSRQQCCIIKVMIGW